MSTTNIRMTSDPVTLYSATPEERWDIALEAVSERGITGQPLEGISDFLLVDRLGQVIAELVRENKRLKEELATPTQTE